MEAATSMEAAASYMDAAASASLSGRHGAESCKCHGARDERPSSKRLIEARIMVAPQMARQPSRCCWA